MFRSVKVGTTTVKICSYNPKRRSITIYNYSGGTVFISQDPARVYVEGFPIPLSSVVTLSKEDGDEPELDLYAVATEGGATLRVHEGLGEGE